MKLWNVCLNEILKRKYEYTLTMFIKNLRQWLRIFKVFKKMFKKEREKKKSRCMAYMLSVHLTWCENETLQKMFQNDCLDFSASMK